MENLKHCKLCDSSKIIEDFHKNKNSKDGYNNVCKVCACKRAVIWSTNNLEKVVRLKKIRRDDIRKSLLESAQNRSNKYNIELTIKVEDIVVPEFCPILKIPLVKNKKVHKDNSPSLDKIIPELGYVKENIQVISYKANIMKHNASINELLLFAEWINTNFKAQE